MLIVERVLQIDIMRRLRHPNVLLFMGAVCTEEKLAMVTEYLTRYIQASSFLVELNKRLAIDI